MSFQLNCCNMLMIDMQPNDGEQQSNSKRFNRVSKTMRAAKNTHHIPKSTHN